MSILFGCNFDGNLNETCSGIVADTNQGLVHSTSLYKFGGGSIRRFGTGARTITWLSFTAPNGDSGTLGFWVRDNATSAYFIEIGVNYSLIVNRTIWINILGSASTHNVSVTMTDTVDALVVSLVLSGGTPPGLGVWHYYELNWLWNNAAGITELSFDGAVLLSSTSGNTSSRAGRSESEVSMRLGSSDHLDDFVILPGRKHVGNFTPPTSSQVICTTGQISFGSQLNRFGAGFSR